METPSLSDKLTPYLEPRNTSSPTQKHLFQPTLPFQHRNTISLWPVYTLSRTMKHLISNKETPHLQPRNTFFSPNLLYYTETPSFPDPQHLICNTENLIFNPQSAPLQLGSTSSRTQEHLISNTFFNAYFLSNTETPSLSYQSKPHLELRKPDLIFSQETPHFLPRNTLSPT